MRKVLETYLMWRIYTEEGKGELRGGGGKK
jgi:hypothetical protein